MPSPPFLSTFSRGPTDGFKPAEVNVIALDWADSLPFTSSSSAALSSAPAAPNGAGATAAEIKRRLPAGIRRRPDLIVAADVVRTIETSPLVSEFIGHKS
jgi:hypothetical protein